MEEVPHCTTVELMARELGAIAELQTAETAFEISNTTFGFDAITRGGGGGGAHQWMYVSM